MNSRKRIELSISVMKLFNAGIDRYQRELERAAFETLAAT